MKEKSVESVNCLLTDRQVVLFDLDGTLLDSREFLVKESYATMEKYYPGTCSYEAITENFGGGFSRLLPVAYTPHHQLALDDFYSVKMDSYHIQSELFPGVLEGLREMKERGFGLAIVTNQQKQVALNAMEHHDILSLFDLIVASEDVLEGKPSPEGIIKAMNDLKADPGVVTMIGDSQYDVIAAQQANVKSGLLTWYRDVNVAESCNPDFITSSFEDLLNEFKKGD